MPTQTKQAQDRDSDHTRALRSVFGGTFAVSAPTPHFPHHLVVYDYRAVFVVEVIEQTLIENDRGRWEGASASFAAETRLADLADAAHRTMPVDRDRIVPVLWMQRGITGNEKGTPGVVCSPSPADVLTAVADLARGLDARLPAGQDDGVVATFVGNSQIEASKASREGGNAFARLARTIRRSLEDEKAIGRQPMRVMGLPVSMEELVDPTFMLPVLAIVAYEDWGMATRRRTHGTGFTVEIVEDPKAMLGIRLVNIRPAVPFVALAPIVSAAMRCRTKDGFAFDDLLRQAARWAFKNDIDPKIFMDITRQVGTRS